MRQRLINSFFIPYFLTWKEGTSSSATECPSIKTRMSYQVNSKHLKTWIVPDYHFHSSWATFPDFVIQFSCSSSLWVSISTLIVVFVHSIFEFAHFFCKKTWFWTVLYMNLFDYEMFRPYNNNNNNKSLEFAKFFNASFDQKSWAQYWNLRT